MAYILPPRPIQEKCRSLRGHLVLILSLCLSPAQIQASRTAHYQGVKEIARGDGQVRQLEAGRPIERELSGGQSHSYRITMAAGQYLHLVVDQRGIDVVVVLLAPDGEKRSEVDSPNGTAGPEVVSAIAEAAGVYRIEVRALGEAAGAGRYEIKIEELREANAKDRYRVDAGAVFREAEQLQYGNLEAKRGSIEKYHRALELYRRADDRRGEADTLNKIGLVYWSSGEMKKALENYNEALAIRRATGDRGGEAGVLNNIGAVYQGLGETQNALENYSQALPIIRAVGDRSNEAVILNNIGDVYQSSGEMQKALESYNQSLPISREVGDRNGEANTLNNIGHLYSSLGEIQKALEKHNEALPIVRAVGNRRIEAITLNHIGHLYSSLGEMQKALEKYGESLPLSQATGYRSGEAATLNNIGLAYSSLGEMQKALEKYNEALPIWRAIGERRSEATTLNNLGLAYSSLGEMQKALEKYNEALPIRRATGDRSGEAITLGNIGAIYVSLGDLQKAREKYNEALSIFQAIGERRSEAIALNNIGLVYDLSGEVQKAQDMYGKALLISRAVRDRSSEATTLNNIGRLHDSAGEVQKALEKYNEALPISRAIGDRDTEAIALNNIGRAYNSLGEMQKALENHNEALAIRRSIGDRIGEAGTLLGIARAEEKRGSLSLARQAIEQAINVVESLRANIASQEFRASYLASQQDFYQSYVDILMQMHEQNPTGGFDAVALAVSERARARSLLELLAEARADIRQGVDSSLLERERSLQQRLTAKAAAQIKLSTRKQNSAQAEAMAKEIASITAEYEELQAQIRASSPRYAALTQPQPLSLSEIQQQVLDPETLLLEYSLGEDASYLFVVSNTSITSHRLPKQAAIEAATRQVRELLTAPQPRPGDSSITLKARIRKARADYWPQAAALSRMLLGPATQQLGTKRLLIVADGALQYLPFGALPVPETPRRGDGETGRPEGNPPRPPVALTPLMVEHEIVHLPSASTLAVLRRELAGRKPAPRAVAVLADPVFSADDARVKLAALAHNARAGKEKPKGGPSELTRALTDVRGDLARLLMSRDEAQAILSLTPANSRLEALDFRASRATSTSDELGQYRIVHFATHGLLNSQHPNLSGLVLSLVDERGQPQDGFLQLHEVFNLRLPAELVVLSACQTGLGKEIKGEGLVGLTRGFMYAGAARVMASLWQVDDAATAGLMKRFYQGMLKEGKRPAAALRAAQVEMWKRPQWQSPYYWGAFVLQGEWK
jgi:tetratricopeptide (TPR) repeat protein